MVHKVWLYFTQYAWVDVEAASPNEAYAIAWAWQDEDFPLGEERLARFPQIKDFGR